MARLSPPTRCRLGASVGGLWTISFVFQAGDIGNRNDIARDYLNRPMVAFYEATDGLPRFSRFE